MSSDKNKKHKTTTRLAKSILTHNRQQAIDAGFNDGRFMNKTIPDKKRKSNKRAARKKIRPHDDIS